MSRKISHELDSASLMKTDTTPAEAEVTLLKSRYAKTLAEYFDAPATVSLSRAARAMYRLGRIRQWQAINATARGQPAPNLGALRSGILESLAGTHAMVIHQKHWCGTHYHKSNLTDLALQVAMLLAHDWRDLAAFVLREWFGDQPGPDSAGCPALSGVGGLIVGVAGQALGVEVAQSTFRNAESTLADMVLHWQGDETAFIELAVHLADRHVAQSHGHTSTALAEFEHPIEQAVPVELLMLLRLRGHAAVPRWLEIHPAMAHPAAALFTPAPPRLTQRCEQFSKQTSQCLPEFEPLGPAIVAQQRRMRDSRTR